MNASSAVAPSIARFVGRELNWRQRLPYPLRNAAGRWRSLAGMIVGVGIALSIGMTLLAVISAEMDLLTGDYERSGIGMYVATDGGKLVARLPGDTPGTIQHARSALSQVRAWPETRSAIGTMAWTMTREQEGPRRHNQPTEIMSVMGVDGDPTQVPNMLAVVSGRWLRTSTEVVVGRTLAQQKSLSMGDTLRLNGGTYTIVGIGKLRGFSAFGQDALVYMEYRAFQQRAQLGDVLNVIAVDTAQPARARQRLEDLGGLTAWTPRELVQQAESANASGMVIDWMLILLTLAIAGLFVNTMLSHSVSERRAEFAVLRAIGLPARTVVLTVALEAITITIAAGLLAVGISLLFGFLINTLVAASYGIESLFKVDPSLFLLVFALAAGLGVISGIVPARRAATVNPVEVLREV